MACALCVSQISRAPVLLVEALIQIRALSPRAEVDGKDSGDDAAARDAELVRLRADRAAIGRGKCGGERFTAFRASGRIDDL
jgi:hypothetical protein